MNTADVMTRRVVTVTPETLVADAARMMIEHRVSGLPVVEGDGRVVGVVTEGDLLRRVETGTERTRGRWRAFFAGPGKLASEFVQSHGRKVGEVMNQTLVSATEATPLADIVTLMEKHHVKRVPVMRDGKLVGIVSRADLLRALAAVPPPALGGTATDADIIVRVEAEIERQPWGRASSIRVIARDGVVHLSGTIVDERFREALRVLAENQTGVTKVVDDMVWIDPTSGYVIGASSSSEDAA